MSETSDWDGSALLSWPRFLERKAVMHRQGKCHRLRIIPMQFHNSVQVWGGLLKQQAREQPSIGQFSVSGNTGMLRFYFPSGH
jgi:hypothetical protein